MKKFLILVLLSITSTSYAYEFSNGLYLSTDISLNSAYLWRGQHLSNACIQPVVSFGYTVEDCHNISHTIDITYWGSYCGKDYGQQEADLMLTYCIEGSKTSASITLAHYYYCDGSKYFNYANTLWDECSTGMSVSGQLIAYKDYPLTFYFETSIGGSDNGGKTLTANGSYKRFYSTYLEASYPFELDYDICITPRVGVSPNKSVYNEYSKAFSVNNVGGDISKTWSYNLINVRIFAQLMFNFYDISCFSYNKNFMWNAGVGISL